MAKQYTPDQYSAILQQRLKNIKEFRRAEFIEIQESYKTLIDRIFEKGLNGRNEEIGTYKKYKVYVGSVKQARGARRKLKAQSFPSYSAFKQSIGGLSTVNLKLFGDLKSDMNTSLTAKRTLGALGGIKRRANIPKVAAAIERYGLITFDHTRKEKKDLNKRLGKRLLKYFSIR